MLNNVPATAWTLNERIAFRLAFIFFLLMSIPTTPDWYSGVLSINWLDLHYRDFYDIARFGSGVSFFGNTIFGSRLNGYTIWIITLIVSMVLAAIWTVIAERKKNRAKEYVTLYYWLRVIVRYRAAIGIIGFGYTKLFPVQMPYPSISLLNNDFGDLTGHKIYWLSVGISPWYQVFGGVVEVVAGILLLFRKTTAYGAALLFGALATITVVNLGYDGGVHVYASYFVLLALFLLIPDAKLIYRLIVLEKFTVPNVTYPAFQGWARWLRVGLKSFTIFLFLGLLTYYQWVNFRYDPYKQPSTPGVANLRGYYNVSEFRINGELIPYSPLDSTRWSEVTFEKWSSMTYKVKKPVQIDLSNGGGDPMQDINRTFELTGVAGGRRVFHYLADTLNRVLYLEDKNNPFASGRRGGTGGRLNAEQLKALDKDTVYPADWIPSKTARLIGSEYERVHPLARNARRREAFASEPVIKARSKMLLAYSTNADGSKVTLRGTDENRDSIFVALDRIDKEYLLSETKLVAGEY